MLHCVNTEYATLLTVRMSRREGTMISIRCINNESCAPQHKSSLDVLFHLLSQVLHIGLSKGHLIMLQMCDINEKDWRKSTALLSRWGRGCWKGPRRCRPHQPQQLYQCWLPNSRSSLPWSPPQTPVSWSRWLIAWFYRSSVKMVQKFLYM